MGPKVAKSTMILAWRPTSDDGVPEWATSAECSKPYSDNMLIEIGREMEMAKGGKGKSRSKYVPIHEKKAMLYTNLPLRVGKEPIWQYIVQVHYDALKIAITRDLPDVSSLSAEQCEAVGEFRYAIADKTKSVDMHWLNLVGG